MTLEEIKKAAEEIRDRMETLLQDKQRDLEELNAARAEREIMRAGIKEKMDAAASATEYAELKKDFIRLSSEIEFYENRITERRERDLVTEIESDATVDRLLDLEREGEKAFAKTVLENLDALKEHYTAYGETWREIENILKQWTRRVYPNYRGFGTTYTVDGMRTNRSPKPVPIRAIPYSGGKIYETAEEFMRTAERLREEKKNV